MLSTSQASADEKIHKNVKNNKMLEFHDHIWNHHKKCIPISTNMTGIGSLIHEITVQISDVRKLI